MSEALISVTHFPVQSKQHDWSSDARGIRRLCSKHSISYKQVMRMKSPISWLEISFLECNGKVPGNRGEQGHLFLGQTLQVPTLEQDSAWFETYRKRVTQCYLQLLAMQSPCCLPQTTSCEMVFPKSLNTVCH